MVSKKARWLTIASGCFVGVAGSLAMGGGFAIFPLIQIVGALLEPRFPRLGMGLMCAGSILVSFWVFWIAILFILESHSVPELRFILTLLTSTFLVIASDTLLLKEYLKIRRADSVLMKRTARS